MIKNAPIKADYLYHSSTLCVMICHNTM